MRSVLRCPPGGDGFPRSQRERRPPARFLPHTQSAAEDGAVLVRPTGGAALRAARSASGNPHRGRTPSGHRRFALGISPGSLRTSLQPCAETWRSGSGEMPPGGGKSRSLAPLLMGSRPHPPNRNGASCSGSASEAMPCSVPPVCSADPLRTCGPGLPASLCAVAQEEEEPDGPTTRAARAHPSLDRGHTFGGNSLVCVRISPR